MLYPTGSLVWNLAVWGTFVWMLTQGYSGWWAVLGVALTDSAHCAKCKKSE